MSSGGAASGLHPLLDEPKGDPEESLADLEVEGTDVPSLTTTYRGAYTPGEPDSEYVRCSYGNDPDNLGHTRLAVNIGTVGTDPIAEFALLDVDQGDEATVSFDPSGTVQKLLFLMRTPSEKSPDLAFEYGASGAVTSTCFFTVDEFTTAMVSGAVACKDLIDTSGGSGTLSASVSFECPLGDPISPSDGSGGQVGSGGAPPSTGGHSSSGGEVATGGTPIATGGMPSVCTDGDIRTCQGDGNCEGHQTCKKGDFGACECPPPDLLLQKNVPWSDTYESYVDQTTGSGLSSVATSMASQGYVITGAVANTVPYTLIGVRPKGSTKTYQAKVIQEYGSTLSSGVADLAQAGYLPTVGTINSIYTIIGVRDPDQPVTYLTQVEQATGSELRATLQGMGSEGYAPMVLMTGSVPYTVIGVKPTGATTVYECQMSQGTGSQLDGAATDLTSAGYTITALVDNTVPFTLIAARKKGDTAPLSSLIDQTTGSGLTLTTNGLASAGWLLLAATGKDAPYTFVAMKP